MASSFYEDDVPAPVRSDEWDGTVVPSGLVDSVPSYMLPDDVKRYLVHFVNKFRSSTSNVEYLYETGHKKLTEKFFRDQAWPSSETIAPLVRNDSTFLMFYRELHFRHIYANLQPTIEHRLESFQNYEQIFKFALESKDLNQLRLPDKWLWDMIDEYIYQFQSFSMFRSKLTSRTESEIAILKSNPRAWSVQAVLSTLQALVDKSNIKAILGGAPHEHGSSTLEMLGFFSIIGLLRVHTLLGDYHLALRTLDVVEMSKKSLYTRVFSCQITVFYYLGFCYLMMRRYQDAVRVFTNILVYILRSQHVHTRFISGYDNVSKKRDQLFNLLGLAVTLHPRRVDENVHSQLMEKVGDRIQRLRSGSDEGAMEELFSHGCPKFISPVSPNYDAPPQNLVMDPYRLQSRLFLEEATAYLKLSNCRSYLKLYSTLPLAKLAKFLAMDVDKLRAHLLCYKHKFNQLVWTSGPVSGGTRTAPDDVDFFINGDMVHIADVKVARCYGEYFIHQMNKIN